VGDVSADLSSGAYERAYSMGGHYAVWLSENPEKKIKKETNFNSKP